METETFTIWVLTDGAPGNEAQARGLAEALARRLAPGRACRIALRRIAPKPWTVRIPAHLWHGLGAKPGGWPFTAYNARVRRIRPPWPDLAIGAGRWIAPLVAALSRLHQVRTVQILDPRVPLEDFGLVVIPEHDQAAGPNVISTLGALGRVTPETAAAAAEAWAAEVDALPRPRVAVLIGGPGRGARFSAGAAGRLAEALEALADAGHGLMVTPSRRSPEGLLPRLQRRLRERAYIWDGEGDNPYPGILGLADAVLVTADSVTMASEAASAGKPVHVFGLRGMAAKLRRFHAALEAHGAARPFEGAIGSWSYTPLAEADRVAGEVEARLLGGAGSGAATGDSGPCR